VARDDLLAGARYYGTLAAFADTRAAAASVLADLLAPIWIRQPEATAREAFALLRGSGRAARWTRWPVASLACWRNLGRSSSWPSQTDPAGRAEQLGAFWLWHDQNAPSCCGGPLIKLSTLDCCLVLPRSMGRLAR
jgi:hypothetical protein